MCAHMTGLNGALNALRIRVCIPTNKSKYCKWDRTQQIFGDVVDPDIDMCPDANCRLTKAKSQTHRQAYDT